MSSGRHDVPTSQNGYAANDRSLIRSATIAGTDVKVAVRKGPAGDLLLYAAARWHREVEPLRAPDGVLDAWGYAERTIRGSSTTLSNHCLTGDTMVWTYDGPQRIEDLSGTTATLLTRDPTSARLAGSWTEAPVSYFGDHPTYRVVLRRGTRRREIRATAEHRWFVQRATSEYEGDYRSTYKVVTEERQSQDLQPGDKLAAVYPSTTGMARLRPSPFGVAHGLTFGDGTVQPSGGRGGSSCKVVLWGNKQRLGSWFPQGCPTSRRDRESGITGLEIRSLPSTYKTPPSLEESSSYLAGWLAGYFAADGCVQPDEITMSSRSREHLEHVRAIAARFGIATREPRVQKNSGGYKPGDSWSISFTRATVPDWMILRDEHVELLSSARATRQVRWHVESVEPTGIVEPVYCATVAGTGAFALDDWILTGNSSGTALDLRARAHPLGRPAAATFTPAQIAAVDQIVADCRGALRWGARWSRPDGMHLEVVATEAACARVLAQLTAIDHPALVRPASPAVASPRPLLEEDDVHIPITPDSAGAFRVTVMAEVGASSATGYREGWVTLGSTWGDTDFVVTALGADGPLWQFAAGRDDNDRLAPMRIVNNRQWSGQLPDGTRLLTIEGNVAHLGAVPAAAVWHVR
jgi:hypothetical protein